MASTMYQFKLPDLAEGVHEGQVIRVHVQAGQSVREDDPLMEVETDKAAVEIPSPVSGRVVEVHVSESELVHVGDVMVTFDSSSPPAASAPAPTTTPTPTAATNTSSAATSGKRKPASPSVRRLARERRLDLTQVRGSGPGGRVTRADVEQAATARSTETPVAPAVVSPDVLSSETSAPIAAARISTPQATPTTAIEGVADTDQYGNIVRQGLSQARRAISRVMQTSVADDPTCHR